MSCFGSSCRSQVKTLDWEMVKPEVQEKFVNFLSRLRIIDGSYKTSLSDWVYAPYYEDVAHFNQNHERTNPPNKKYYDELMEMQLSLLHAYEAYENGLKMKSKGGTNRKSRKRKDNRKKRKGRARTRKYTRF